VSDQGQDIMTKPGIEQGEQIVPASIFRNVLEIPAQFFGMLFSRILQKVAEDLTLTLSTTDIPAIEERLHRQTRILGHGRSEQLDRIIFLATNSTRLREEIQDSIHGRMMGHRALVIGSDVRDRPKVLSEISHLFFSPLGKFGK
jgi:hypothetical protein